MTEKVKDLGYDVVGVARDPVEKVTINLYLGGDYGQIRMYGMRLCV